MRRASFALLVGAALALSCEGRPRSGSYGASGSKASSSLFGRATGKLVEIDLTQGAPESAGGGLFPMPASRTYVGLVRALERARDDQDAKGVFVRLGERAVGFARAREVGGLLGEIRKAGKPVVCHAHGLDNAGAWVALAGCDRIWLSPAGEIASVGIAGQMVYFKSALDKLKIGADFLHVGKFKSASEPMTRDGPSDEARLALTETLGSIRKSWLDGVEAARKNPQLRSDMEHGPWSPREAKERGLVDALGYESEALDEAKKRAGTERVSGGFGARSEKGDGPDIAELIRILSGADDSAGGRPHIALVPAEGSISMAPGGLLDGGGITAKALTKTLRKVAKDDSVKAVVLRIDSPGGSALASDLLWYELRELGKKKPIIASVGEMAASGGYYLACAAERIIAEPTSIVGSIGVLGGKIVLNDALAEYGINTVTFPASPEPGAAARATYLSGLARWDDPTRVRVQKQMDEVYQLFLERVAEGRKLPIEKIRESAEGRIWSGQQGLDRKLVDELGGLARALQVARELGKLDERAPVEVVGKDDSLFESLILGEAADAKAVEGAVARVALAREPFTAGVASELRPFVAGLAPLLANETVLTTLPFALVVR
ncbi:MAG: signal peptide peptidase SppA [Myxococcales bacterium]|nr:signal peptide peptidase SppA [Myxococcales bacterium]